MNEHGKEKTKWKRVEGNKKHSKINLIMKNGFVKLIGDILPTITLYTLWIAWMAKILRAILMINHL